MSSTRSSSHCLLLINLSVVDFTFVHKILENCKLFVDYEILSGFYQ